MLPLRKEEAMRRTFDPDFFPGDDDPADVRDETFHPIVTPAIPIGPEAIPKDKSYPADSVQCNHCGGLGCDTCGDKGWFTPKDHPSGRRCENPSCNEPLPPDHFQVYCSNECAAADAQP